MAYPVHLDHHHVSWRQQPFYFLLGGGEGGGEGVAYYPEEALAPWTPKQGRFPSTLGPNREGVQQQQQPLPEPPASLGRYFRRFNGLAMRYEPVPELASLYPEDGASAPR
jgi:hypothetical protein